MTDKEIIIDGRNVTCWEESEIKYLIASEKPSKRTDIAMQFYKQLKRLEQDNQNLRESMKKDFCSHYVLGECSQSHHNNCVGRNQCIKDLEQENARLKEDVRYYKELARDNDTLLKQAHQDFTNHIQKQKLEIDNYRQCLQEIKEIAAEIFKNYMDVGFKEYDESLEKILQKIDEVSE